MKVTEDTFKHKVWPKKHPIAGQPVVLRDYQIEIINNYLVKPTESTRRLLQVQARH
jgi:hypothetical protein